MKLATSIDDLPRRQAKVRCNLCNKIYSKQGFHYHINGVHRKLRVKCDICGKEGRPDFLWSHKKTFHSLPSSNEKVKEKDQLKNHTECVHVHNNPRVKCHICGKAVKKGSLKDHKLRREKGKYLNFATPIDDKSSSNKVKCNLCGNIVSKPNISVHIKNVHFHLKVKCDVCGKEVRKDSLKKHKLNIHSP